MTAPLFPTGVAENDPGALVNWDAVNTLLNGLRLPDGSGWYTAGQISTLVGGVGPADLIPDSDPIQVLDFDHIGSYTMLLTDNTKVLFKNLVAGEAKRIVVYTMETGPGGYIPTFPGVADSLWEDGPFAGSSKPTQAQQTFLIKWTFDCVNVAIGTGVTGRAEAIGSGLPPGAPNLLNLSPAAAAITATWDPPMLTGDNMVAPEDLVYTIKVATHAAPTSILQTHTVNGTDPLTTTFSTLAGSTSHDVTIVATAPSTLVSTTVRGTVSTTAGSSSKPGTPLNLIATNPASGKIAVSFAPPASDGGAAIDHYTVGYSLPGAGTPAIVQSNAKGSIDGSQTIKALPNEFTSNLTQGNRLIIAVTDNNFTATRAVTCSSGPMTLVESNDNTDCHVEIWERTIGASEGKPTITFACTNASGSDRIQIAYYEVSNLGTRDTAANVSGPQTFGKLHVPAGKTGTLGQADEWMLAAWCFSADISTPTFVLNDGTPTSGPTDVSFTNTTSPFANVRGFNRYKDAVLHHTSGTTAVGVAAKVTSALNGCGCIGTWKTAGTSFSHSSTITLPAALTDSLTGLAPGVYTVTCTAHNTNGDTVSAASTTVQVAPVVTPPPPPPTGIAAVRGTIASNTQAAWTAELNAYAQLAPVGSLAMNGIFLGVAGLDNNTGEGSAWGDWQFYATAGAKPRPAIFIYLCDDSVSFTAPLAGVSLADMAGADPGGTAAQINAFNRATAIASYFSHPEVVSTNPIFRLGWEMDQGWTGWSPFSVPGAAGNNATDFKAAWGKFRAIILAACPTAVFDFNVSAGCGGGPFTFDHGHSFWDSFYPSSAPPEISGLDFYGDLPVGAAGTHDNATRLQWFRDDITAHRNWCISKGILVAYPEFGVSSTTLYNGVNSSNIAVDGAGFIDVACDAIETAASLGILAYHNVFDAFDPSNPGATGGRGLRNVPGQAGAAPRYKFRQASVS